MDHLAFSSLVWTGGQWDEPTDQEEAARFLITGEEDSRLNLDALYDERTRYTDEDRASFDETDFERSVSLAYDDCIERGQFIPGERT